MIGELKILVTGAGAPGIVGTLYSLKNNYDCRKVKIIGVDANEEVVGKYLLDAFYLIPFAKSEAEFIEKIKEIVVKERINIILPQVTDELFIFAKHRDEFKKLNCFITISDINGINFANDKYNLSELAKSLDVPVPEFYKVNNFSDLKKYAKKLGFPEKRFVVKPPISSGMRGYREVVSRLDLKDKFYTDKPNDAIVTLDGLYNIIGNNFPELILMEYLPGKEWSVDGFGYFDRGQYKCVVVPRTRDQIRTGITFAGTVLENKTIIKSVFRICEKIKLEYMFGFQFKEDSLGVPKLIESNPRIQGTMVMSTLANANIIYDSVKYALGETIPSHKVNWGTKFIRYWGGVSVYENKFCNEVGGFK